LYVDAQAKGQWRIGDAVAKDLAMAPGANAWLTPGLIM
jgi:hypothetical protein